MTSHRLLLPPLLLLAVAVPTSGAERRPNVVFIVADDLGWADTTLYGKTQLYRTPNVERLAKRGMTFTRAYSASPLCSPTRAALLTGLSPARVGITAPQCHLPQVALEASAGTASPPTKKAVLPKSATRLRTDLPTLPKLLKKAGYATGHFGKWHLGREPYSPLQHGFDVDVPHWPGPGPAGSYVAPWKFPDFDPDVPNEHIEDRMAAEAVAWMEQHRDEPFLLNYWMFSVHAPFDAKQELIARYRKRIDPRAAQRSPTYAAMVESMDDAVGTLLDALDRLELTDDTIVVFTSDNGGNTYSPIDGTMPTSNAPLRGGKATMFEGGVRVPCVVAWPGRVQPGTTSDAFVQSEDFLPTLLDALDVAPAAGQAFDGASVLPVLVGETPTREVPFERVDGTTERSLFTYFPHDPPVPDWLPPSAAVHRGRWKLIRVFHEGEEGAHQHRLYDLATDVGEKRDLAAEMPGRVTALSRELDGFLAETKAVLPVPNPAFDPERYRPELVGVGRLRKPGGRPAADPLKSWKARNCTATVEQGVVRVTGTGASPFLGVGAGVSGPVRVAFRIRSEKGGAGRVEWIDADGRPHSVFYEHAAGGWRDVTVELPAKGPVRILRVYVPAGEQPVELDWVELKPQRGKRRRWAF